MIVITMVLVNLLIDKDALYFQLHINSHKLYIYIYIIQKLYTFPVMFLLSNLTILLNLV